MTEKQRQLCMDFQTTFDHPAGKRTLQAILDFSTYDQRYNPNVHPSVTWCDLGKREMYFFVKDKIEADTSEPEQQQEASVEAGENKEGRQQEKAESEATDAG